MSTFQVNTKNNYEFTDYQLPIIKNSNDFRTSYYHGHNYYIVPDKSTPNVSIKNVCEVLGRKETAYEYVTEASDQYQWKFPLMYRQRAQKAVTSNRPQFIQTIHEKLIKAPPKPITQYDTVYRQVYERKYPVAEETFPFDIQCQSPEKPINTIYANTQGHYKYLDPFMTTNMMDHKPYTENQQYGIARKDALTVWDWLEMPKTTTKGHGLKEYPVKQRGRIQPICDSLQFNIPIKDRIITNSRKFVPHYGITSEMRSNYDTPVEMTFDPELYKIQPLNIPPTGIKTGDPEYTMYGSGKRTHTILDAKGRTDYVHQFCEKK